jgi:hypothetical protein
MTPDREPRLSRTRDGEDLALIGLGALSWLDRFAAAAEQRAGAPDAPDEALLAAMLGLLSLRRSLHRWAGQAVTEPAPATPAHDGPEGLLR